MIWFCLESLYELVYAVLFIGIVIFDALRNPERIPGESEVRARERDQAMKQEWMDKVFHEANRGLKTNTVESVHPSLLVLKELLELVHESALYQQLKPTLTSLVS
ncbi:hypothetical protein B0H65DRAFT_540333 [Neurospora tetraspora]|uniref:Uncharacterized protein n=1 Tax=Neurospora tetraspora TaxID=94610 RepID=A0AAE0JCN6_9PEZI|nr:hypothetical protein B0H65DRAFT_540333 [Neurospora tetraspora]